MLIFQTDFLNFEIDFFKGPMNTAQKCCHETDKIEGEQPNCHFTINEVDAGDAAPSR
jgi:hypothetical protein